MLIFDLNLKGIKHIGTLSFNDAYVHSRKNKYNWNRIKKFPTKNSVKLTRILINKFCPERGYVIDPMCGIGTTVVEAISMNRNGYGTEICEEYINSAIENCQITKNNFLKTGNYKILWKPAQELSSNFPLCFFDFALFSPPYGKQTHDTGETKKQKEMMENFRLFSCQNYVKTRIYPNEDVLSGNLESFYEKMLEIISEVGEVLKFGGKMAIIVQDYVRKGKPVGIVQELINISLGTKNLIPFGYYIRRLDQQLTMFKMSQHKRGYSVMGVEHVLIFEKRKYDSRNNRVSTT